MKAKRLLSITTLLCVLCLSACSQDAKTTTQSSTDSTEQSEVQVVTQSGDISAELVSIPQEYKSTAEQPGTLERLDYTTWESMTYAVKTKPLTKTAYVYLPYGYSDEKEYNVFYLMHGGWSNEETWLGTPDQSSEFKNVIDHAIEDGKMEPLIIVCPTYNNESPEDSSNYSLALTLTDNYHNELINDLIPAVEGKYSTYAAGTTPEALKESRNHRGFGGFSMGSVATWHAFEYCLDYFCYFMPMSGNLTSDGAYMASIVKNAGYDWNGFFIYAMSGTDDFAYSAFRSQIEAMTSDESGIFRETSNEQDGNLAFRIQEGGVHNGEYASEYAYNGLLWFWNQPGSNQKSMEPSGDSLTAGSTEYRGFSVDNVLHSKEQGDIHFHLYLPDAYDGSEPYALYVTLPGYQGLYFQGVAENLKTESFGFEAQKYNDKMIIAAPQLSDWGELSADQTIDWQRKLLEIVLNLRLDNFDIQAFIDTIGQEFPNFEITQQAIDIYTNLHNNTRLMVNRGYTPAELSRKYNPHGALPTSISFGPGIQSLIQSGKMNVDEFVKGFETMNIPQDLKRSLISETDKAKQPKPGRNDSCPCGSGKKYKKCCGR